jgi:hypothetical protein
MLSEFADMIDSGTDVLPDAASLSRALAAVLPASDLPPGGAEIIGRVVNPYARTFPTEIVTYRRVDGGTWLACVHGWFGP